MNGRRAPLAPLMVAMASALVPAIMFGTADRAEACSCFAFTDDTAYAAADAVFTGRLVATITPPGDTLRADRA